MDRIPHSPDILGHDIRKGIPFPNGSLDVVYHSHLLEHLPREEGSSFMLECFRVLRDGGILRVVVPDLESIVRQYLSCLDAALAEKSNILAARYDWSVIELIDQLSRQKSGGLMEEYWKQDILINEQQIIDRVGEEFRGVRAKLLESKTTTNAKLSVKGMIKKILSRMDVYRSFRVGQFRLSGEVHQWMYDRYSLTNLLEEVGFHSVVVRDQETSYIHDWTIYKTLDAIDKKPRKPDSLMMEGLK